MSSKLVFINTSGPEDSKSSDKRKAVRSQAAKDHSQSSSGRTEGTSRRRHRKLLSVELELDVYESETSGSGSTPTKTGSTSTAQEAPSNLNSIQRRPHGGKPDPIVGSSKMPGAGGTRPSVPSTLSHQISKLAVDVPELDYPGAKGSLRSIWMPMTQCSPEVLCQRKQDALSSINRALRDPDFAISDQVIAAVAKMAAYEADSGEEGQYHIHMKGLSKMVELRGGLESLGSLARMVLFIDLNSAFLLKTKLYFSHQEHAIP